MPEFIYHCPDCGQEMKCDSEQFDGTVIATCPKCQQEICPEDSGEKPQPEIIKLSPRKPEPAAPQKESSPKPEQKKTEKKPLTLEEILKKEHAQQNDYSYPTLCYVFNIAAALNGIGVVASLVFFARLH